MTRKDYKIIAECIRKSLENLGHLENVEIQNHYARATARIVYQLQKGLEQENPRFNGDTFYEACGL